MSIDIQKFSELVSTLSSVGIDQLLIEPLEDGRSQVKGANANRTIVVYDEIEEQFCESSIAIAKLAAVQSRLALFDIEKASLSFKETESGSYVTEIIIKEGRRKASYRCASPTKVAVPRKLASYDLPDGEPVTFTSEFVSYLNSVVSAITMTGKKDLSKIGMSCDGGELTINVSDGDSDTFNTTEEVEDVEDFDFRQWNVKAFVQLLKHCSDLDENNNAKFYIAKEVGFCYFISEPVNYLTAPEVN